MVAIRSSKWPRQEKSLWAISHLISKAWARILRNRERKEKKNLKKKQDRRGKRELAAVKVIKSHNMSVPRDIKVIRATHRRMKSKRGCHTWMVSSINNRDNSNSNSSMDFKRECTRRTHLRKHSKPIKESSCKRENNCRTTIRCKVRDCTVLLEWAPLIARRMLYKAR